MAALPGTPRPAATSALPRSAGAGRADPPPATAPLLARLTAKPGPAESRLIERAGARVLVVPGRYSVSYLLLGEEAVAVVDLGSNADHSAVLRALSWLGRPVSQLRYVLPTHLHMDHIMGIDRFARRFALPVALGRTAHQAVTGGRTLRFPRPLHTLRAIPTYVMQGAPRGALTDWLHGLDFGFPWSKNRFRAELTAPLDDGTELPELPGWTVLHTPGHSEDSLCLYHSEARFLIAGDTARNFSGGEWNPLLTDPAAYRQTQDRLRQLDIETIFPGHGPLIEGPQVIGRLLTRSRFAP